MKCALRFKKKPKQTYHNEHCWKYLQVSYMKNYHRHRFHICLSLPLNSKHDHSLLATKNNKNKNSLCHSAQWKTMKVSNVSFPLPQNTVVHGIYHYKPSMVLDSATWGQNRMVQPQYTPCVKNCIRIHNST